MDAKNDKSAASSPPPKAKKPNREKKPEKPVVIPPAVWLGLLVLPFLGYVLNNVFLSDLPSAAPAIQQATAQADNPAPAEAQAPRKMGIRGRWGIAPPEETIPMDKLKSCDFDDWVGKPLNRPLLKRHLLPYRVLVPGTGPITPGGDPLVLNIEINRSEIVTKVWCG